MTPHPCPDCAFFFGFAGFLFGLVAGLILAGASSKGRR